MLEALKYVIGAVQRSGAVLRAAPVQQKHPPRSQQYELQTLCGHIRSLISTSNFVVIMVLVNWRRSKLTNDNRK